MSLYLIDIDVDHPFTDGTGRVIYRAMNFNSLVFDEEGLSKLINVTETIVTTKNDIEPDVITNPSHYCEGRKYEPRKVIADWDLNFNLGSAVKYLSRAGRKEDAVTDLKKAIQFIEFEIEERSVEK